MTKTRLSAARFKAQCLKLIDDVAATRGEIEISKRGKPLARLAPIEDAPLHLFGCMKGTAAIKGDLTQPLDEPWEADA